jgi:hypothetical protein
MALTHGTLSLRRTPPGHHRWEVLAPVVIGFEIRGAGPTCLRASQLIRSRESVAHTFEIITTAQALRSALQDAERGQRGYLVTGESPYLDAYRDGTRRVPLQLEEFRVLTADNPGTAAVDAQVGAAVRTSAIGSRDPALSRNHYQPSDCHGYLRIRGAVPDPLRHRPPWSSSTRRTPRRPG